VISIDCGSRPLFENGNTTVTTARENYGFCGQMFVEGFLGDAQGADKAAGFFDGFTKLLKESGGGGREYDVIDIQEQVGSHVTLVIDEQRGIRASNAEAHSLQKAGDPLVLGARG
jgi:hypothetical protein